MTNYCESLRQIGAAREEVPEGGATQVTCTRIGYALRESGTGQREEGLNHAVPILTMPGDDITHPIPDLSGYITEGQIVISRELHQKGIYPPINVLPSLSRLMNAGIGAWQTRGSQVSI